MRIFNRYIEIELISTEKKKHIVINTEQAVLDVSVKKYLSHLKDEAVINLYNLGKNELDILTNGNGYDIAKIYAGYGKGEKLKKFLISVNYIISITNDKSDLKQTKTIILCSSRFRNKKQLKSLNFKAGTTIYSTLNLLTRKMGVYAFIDSKLKNKVLKKDLVVQYANNGIMQILRDYDFISVSNDTGGLNYDIQFKEIYNNENRFINITPENGTLVRDWVILNSNAHINFKSLPVINWKIGDIAKVENVWFNQFVDGTENYIDYLKNNNIIKRLSEKNNNLNLFVIYELNYSLSVINDFIVDVHARPYNSFARTLNRGL